MVKNIFATNGDFMLMCPITGQIIEAFRPSVVVETTFFADRRSSGQINVILADIDPEFTDQEWVALLAKHKGDVKKAVAEVLTREEVEDEVEAEAAKKATSSATTKK